MTRRTWLAVAVCYLAVIPILAAWKVTGLDRWYFDAIGLP